VAIARPTLCDPQWPRKTVEGREQEILRCVYCNKCKEGDEAFQKVYCVQRKKGEKAMNENPLITKARKGESTKN
jgi:hypothetical protein